MAADPDKSYDEYALLLDAVRGIRWPARSAVRGGIPGAHTSRLRGISAEFTEYRPYRQGDDPRRIDWKLFARSDRAYIRLSNDRAILPTMIVLDAVRGIRWPARSAVRGGIPGAHTSRLRGISAEFTEYRPYRQGDDPRRIDWKLFARSDRAYIRLSNDRAILPTMILLDASASMAFPEATKGKWKLAAQLGVGLGAVARNSGDPVGLVIAHADEPLLLSPRMRSSVTYDIIRAVSATEPGGAAPLSPSLSIAAQSGGRLVIVSDFLGDAADLLAAAGRWVVAGREVHAIHIVAHEELYPSRESTMVADPESPDIRRPMIGEARDQYIDTFARWRDELAHDWSDAGVAYTMAVTGEESADHLVRRIAAVRSGAAIA